MSPPICHPDSLPWAVFTTENIRRLTLNTRMHPENDSDLQEENIELIPAPLFAGRELRRQLLPSATNTLLESLDAIDDVDQFLDSFQRHITELRTQEAATLPSGELEAVPEEGRRCPSSGSLDLQELIDNKAFYTEEADIGDSRFDSETTAVGTEPLEILRPDVYVPGPLALRNENRANDNGPFTAPMPNTTNTAKVLKPKVSKPRPLLISKAPIAHGWNGNRLGSIVLPPRGGIEVGRSSASTFIDFQIHQELTRYNISSDHVPAKTPPISPKTPVFHPSH